MDRAEYEQLLQQLDQRQDDVLERLDELDTQIERLINVWSQQRESLDETAPATPGQGSTFATPAPPSVDRAA